VDKSALKYIIAEYQEAIIKDLIPRDIEIPLNLNKIITIIGARRSGKTYILHQIINQAIEAGVNKEKILFLNFEDERLEEVEPELILQAYREMYPDWNLSEVWFFFDEIQALNNWHKFLFRLFELNKPKIFVTGSNSKLLSQEIATQLRGRTYTIEINPLSFQEFLKFKSIDTNIYSPSLRPKINNAFDEYLKSGGFPEIVFTPKEFRINLLQNYYKSIFFRDIVERYNIKNIPALKFFIKRLIKNLGKPTSIHKIYNELKSANINVSKQSLYDFLEYCQSVFLCFALPKATLSETKQLTGQSKIYFIDTGLINALTADYLSNSGVLLENIVFNTLRQSGFDLLYFRNSYEVDFIAIKEGKTYLIQVAYSIAEEETLRREIKALDKAKELFPSALPLIITHDTTKETGHVRMLNIVEFLMDLSIS